MHALPDPKSCYRVKGRMGNEELLRWKNLQTFFKAYNHIINKNKLDVLSGAKIFQKMCMI